MSFTCARRSTNVEAGAISVRKTKRVDEHPDKIVERPLTSTRDRRTDCDVVRSTHLRQQHGQGSVNHHEDCRVLLPCDRREPVRGLGIDGKLEFRTAHAGPRRPRPVGRQFQKLRSALELVHPVRELTAQLTVRVLRRSEDITLPQRVVGVLHLERSPLRRLPAGTCGVRNHGVSDQRSHREAVTADVVNDNDEDPLGFVDLEETDSQRNGCRDIEALANCVSHLLGDRRFVGCDHFQSHRRCGARQDHLNRSVALVRVYRPEHFVTLDQIRHRGVKCVDIECAGQPDRDRDVVRTRGLVELIEHPHTLLRQRQRNLVRTHLSHQRWAATRSRVFENPRRQCPDSRRLEDHADRNLRVQRLTQPRHDLRRDERVSAELEEVVVESDPRHTEYVSEHTRHDLFDGVGRRTEFGRLEFGVGQGFAIDLAVDVER